MSLPKHVAIIMDGNGRWAQSRNHSRFYGHLRGAKVAKNIITECSELGIESLTLFTFSTENWFRPAEEIRFLMKLLVRQLKRERKRLVEQGIRFYTIGDLTKLPAEVQEALIETKELTKNCSSMKLTFALNYGGRQEIKKAFQNMAQLVSQGELLPEDISEALISQNMESSFLEDPDLLIRTSGERRLSNFFLWSSAYSEIYFTEKFWPEFTGDDFLKAVDFFTQRKRRFGRIQQPLVKDEQWIPYQ